ncbi:MAG: hypothetical protein ACJ796_04785 [Gemmatimonadaceae bacterium]
MRPLRLPLAAVASALLAASASAQQQQASPVRALGIDTTNFNRAVRPQDDFFRFVNGAWLDHTEIPGDASSWGAFNELTEKSRTAVHQIVEDAAKSNAPAGSEKRKIGDLYSSFMDSARIEQLGTKPLEPTLAQIAAVKIDEGSAFGVRAARTDRNCQSIRRARRSGPEAIHRQHRADRTVRPRLAGPRLLSAHR